MANYYGKNEILTDVVLYLRTVLVTESLSERAEIQRQQLLEKLTKREISPVQAPYLDMSGRSKGLIMKSNSFACLHQQAAYEELCNGGDQPIYNNISTYEDDAMLNYEPFTTNGYHGSPSKHLVVKRHSAPNGSSAGGGSGGGDCGNPSPLNKSPLNGSSSLSSRSNNSDSSESCRSDVIYVSANAVKYSASKYGMLMKREKILFVDHTKKYWAAVLSSTMYVYTGEKELKPCLVIHLEGYTARDTGCNRNKDFVFEIVCPGKKTYQFIAQNEKDMHSWIEAVNNTNSKPSTPEIVLSTSPICFRQDLLPNRELPVPPTADNDTVDQDFCYDKPNPIIRPINLYENPADEVDMESIYHFIDESRQEKEMLPKIDKQFWDGDTSYYNIPSNIPVPAVQEDQNNNNNNNNNNSEYDDFFAEKETCYDVVTNEAFEASADPVLGVQQIIQKIEGINNKRTSPFLRRKSQPKNNSLMRNSTPVYTTDEFYEPMKLIKTNMPTNNPTVVSSQSFRQSRC